MEGEAWGSSFLKVISISYRNPCFKQIKSVFDRLPRCAYRNSLFPLHVVIVVAADGPRAHDEDEEQEEDGDADEEGVDPRVGGWKRSEFRKMLKPETSFTIRTPFYKLKGRKGRPRSRGLEEGSLGKRKVLSINILYKARNLL